MKTMEVDEEVFAAIWRSFQPGDTGENSILRRVLGLVAHHPTAPFNKSESEKDRAPPMPSPTSPLRKELHHPISSEGYTDRRFGVVFPEGFEIFRTFKHKPFKAVAENGQWRLSDGQTAASLNQLSMLVGAVTENAWIGWFYRDGAEIKPISNLRDPARVGKRNQDQ